MYSWQLYYHLAGNYGKMQHTHTHIYTFSVFSCSLHRNQRADVSAQQQRAPLSKLARPLLQLHLRGRKPGADLAPGAQPGPQLPQGHPGGYPQVRQPHPPQTHFK